MLAASRPTYSHIFLDIFTKSQACVKGHTRRNNGDCTHSMPSRFSAGVERKASVSQRGPASATCSGPCDTFDMKQSSRCVRRTLSSAPGLIVVCFYPFSISIFLVFPLPEVKGQTVAQLAEEKVSFRLEPIWTKTSCGLFPSVRPVYTPPALANADL